MMTGRSAHGKDRGRRLDAYEYGQKGTGVAVEGITTIVMLKVGWAQAGRGAAAPRGAFDVQMSPDYRPVLSSQNRIIMQSVDLPETATIRQVLDQDLLPGRTGVTLSDQSISFQQLWNLSERHGVEFSLSREVINGRRVHRLYSGGSNFVESPVSRIRTIAHTHPGDELNRLGSPHASMADIVTHNARWRSLVESGQVSPYNRPFPSRVIYGPGPYTLNGGNHTIFWPFDFRN